MAKLMAMCAPILPGREAAHKQFMNEAMTTWKNEFDASRKKHGVHERTFLQETPHGSLVIVTLEGENPEMAFQQMFAEQDEFTNWFVEQVKANHGFDLRQPPPGPMPELIADSNEVAAFASVN